MRSKNWFGIPILLTGITLLALPALAQDSQSNGSQQQTGDPVADAARKAREQQKKEAKPKRVYTDDDVKPATPTPSTASSPASSSAQGTADATANGQGATQGAATGTGAGAGKGAGKGAAADAAPAGGDEVVWRKRFADQHAKIAAAERELDVLQREENKAEVQYYPDPQKALQQQYSRKDIDDKLAKIDAKKKEIDDLKQQLSDMEDELRKSGGDSGWARQP